MKKIWVYLQKQSFFLMVVLCVAVIGGSGYWALISPQTEIPSAQTDSAPEFVQRLEEAMDVHLYYPVQGKLQKPYGQTLFQQTLHSWTAHEAVDFAAFAGEEVLSAQDGVVAAAYRDTQWGGVVEIVNEKGIQTRYCGLSWPPLVQEAQEIVSGQRIGKIGILPIESAEPCHLHFEMRIHEQAVNPETYF